MRVLALFLLILLAAVPCFPQTFTIDAVSNCWDLPDGVALALGPGTYHIEYVSGAWSPISDDALYLGYAWSSHVRIYVYATGQSGYIGTPYTTLYQSPQLAEAAARGIYTLIIPTNTIVSFWFPEVVNNFNDCSDNRGSVTLRFVQPLAVEPATWGAIKALYR
jgi:hypothetical protein